MNRLVLMLVLLSFAPATVTAQSPHAYLGLFTDENHSGWCLQNPGGFLPFELWVMALPGENGLLCVQFSLEWPANVIRGTVYESPLFGIIIGPLECCTDCYIDCQYDWVWAYHISCWLTDASPSHVEIIENIEFGGLEAANCLEGYTTEPLRPLTSFYLNPPGGVCPPYGVEPTTWGAIKGLFRE